MEGASDDIEGVVSESDEEVNAGGDHGSNGEPFPQAGVDGRESPAEKSEARSSNAGPSLLSSSCISSCALPVWVSQAPRFGSIPEL